MGNLNPKEMMNIITNTNEKNVHELFVLFDRDKSGSISKKEYEQIKFLINGHIKLEKLEGERLEFLKYLLDFQSIDVNKDNKISEEELLNYIKNYYKKFESPKKTIIDLKKTTKDEEKTLTEEELNQLNSKFISTLEKFGVPKVFIF
jgi:Ca2+-binding EF-hand superfamily protein